MRGRFLLREARDLAYAESVGVLFVLKVFWEQAWIAGEGIANRVRPFSSMRRALANGLAAVVSLCVLFCVGCPPTGPQTEGATVVISSYPEAGADISVGMKPYGKTPITITGLPASNVFVELNRERYKRTTKRIDIPDRGERRIVIEMEPLVGYVTFESRPPGAQVFLDNDTLLGETPLIHRAVPVGEHAYELRKDNYKNVPGTVTVEEDYVYSLAHELPAREAEIVLLSRPSGARIWLNDEERTELTPAKFQLTPGDYSLRVHAKGYIMAEQSVRLGANEQKTVELAMKEGDAPPGMVLIPAGEFLMGVDGASPDERPRRKVYVDAFYMDKFEVTNEEYKAVVPTHRFPKGHEQYPVAGVSFYDATKYAQSVGKRLSTEAEWEKAAGGTEGWEYPWGMDFRPDHCNSGASESGGPVRVGLFKLGASPYGCMDMAGNVYEWTSSWYEAYPGNADVTKDYGQVFRVLRGGSFKGDRFRVRCPRRHYDKMDAARDDYGFRCAKDVESGAGLSASPAPAAPSGG